MTCADCGRPGRLFRAVPIVGATPGQGGPQFKLVCESCIADLEHARALGVIGFSADPV